MAGQFFRAIALYFTLSSLFHNRKGIHNPLTWWKLAENKFFEIPKPRQIC